MLTYTNVRPNQERGGGLHKSGGLSPPQKNQKKNRIRFQILYSYTKFIYKIQERRKKTGTCIQNIM